MPADTGQYFNKLRTQFQAGGDIDIIVGDVIWPAQFAANGWIADLTERFTDAGEFLQGPMQSATYEDKVSTPCRGTRTPACSTTTGTCWRRPASPDPRRPGKSYRRWR
jgi:Bacterial extracellular solute-binding protein